MKIGLLFSLTGTTAITERGQCAMAQYAVYEFNKTHKPVEVIIRDIASDPVKAAAEAELLAQNGVKIFVGCYTSACRKAILPVLEKYECMLVYPTLYEGMECHANVFYTGEVPNQQVHILLDFLTYQYGKKVYCIGTDYIYPRETNIQVKKYMKEKEGAVVGEYYVPFGHKQFFTILQDVMVKKPDAIFLTLVGSSVIPFYETYYELGIDPEAIPVFSPITKETEIAAMKPEYAAGHYGAASYFQSLDNDDNQRFLREFRRHTKHDQVVSSVMYNTYLGTKLTLEAIMQAQTTEFRSIFYELSSRKIESACGSILVEDNYRHLARPSRIGRVMDDGQFSIVWDSSGKISARPFMEKKTEQPRLESDVIDLLTQISEEAVVVLSNQNEIVYSSQKANQLIQQHANGIKSPSSLVKLESSFHLNYYKAQDQKLMVITPKPAISINQSPKKFDKIKTLNEAFKKQLEIGEVAAKSTANVLITGETGTGKEVMARAIHMESDRKEEPFVAVNTGAIPKDLIASELFGYTGGSFTGAKKGGGIGKFEAANGGTLFLDEIGDMPYELQVALLRVIESRKIVRVGDHLERDVDVRIIAATNRNLKDEIAFNGTFRSDLYYRLNVLSIDIPPLRQRKEDLAQLVDDIIEEICDKYRSSPKKISSKAIEKISNYPWPGNVRELKNILEQAVLFAHNQEEIEVQHLPEELYVENERYVSSRSSLKNNERELIQEVIKSSSSITDAAKTLGISRSTLYRKLKEYKLS
ncbi:transporter substrate-binding protein [Thalassobacillus devorans]|uniref:transporter substrate-binding protein n=1 Tax=Thalassobacillus devorans TaxID=279813 RepID=UPI000A1CE658|nr:transporter substrate-binding protein [Thalassobacillus devorans]